MTIIESSEHESTHLDPSALGTKEYWDDTYTRELQNHAADSQDEGTIWFDDSGAEEKMIEFLDDMAAEGRLRKNAERDVSDGSQIAGTGLTSFLDLGTGNGHLLFALREAAWFGAMVGVDYSTASVELAQRIGEARRREEQGSDVNGGGQGPPHNGEPPVHFEQYDIVNSDPEHLLQHCSAASTGFDVVLDKGTFDAISLSDERDVQGRRMCETYRDCVLPLIKPGGMVLITSCNWTEDELRSWFEGDDAELSFEDRIFYPSFTFGGKSGTQVVSLCFRKARIAG